MSLRLCTRIVFASLIVFVIAGSAMAQVSPFFNVNSPMSPALCGAGDTPEPGIQGAVPGGAGTANYNCGLAQLGGLPRTGIIQGAGTCAYIRSGANIVVVDVSDPANPVEVG